MFETRWEYNLDSLATRIVHPNGNITATLFQCDLDSTSPPRTRSNERVKARRIDASSSTT